VSNYFRAWLWLCASILSFTNAGTTKSDTASVLSVIAGALGAGLCIESIATAKPKGPAP
jgi:hypothetical protein